MNRTLILTIILLIRAGFLLQGVYAAADVPTLKTTAVSNPPLVSKPSIPTLQAPIGPSANIPDSPVNKPVSGIVHSPVMGVYNSAPSAHTAQEDTVIVQTMSTLPYAPDRLIVRFNSDLASAAGGTDSIAQQAHAAIGATIIADEKTLGVSGMQVLSVPGGTDIQSIIKLYQMNPYVIYAEPDYKYSVNTTTFNPPVVANTQAVSYRSTMVERTTVSGPSQPSGPGIVTPGFVSSTQSEDLGIEENQYAIMPFSPGQVAEIYQQYMATEKLSDASLSTTQGSKSLLSHLQYTPAQRNQGNCGNCWVWASTGAIEVANSVQNNVKDRLSIQYFDSNFNGGSGTNGACNGGWADTFASFHSSSGFRQVIPWSNTNAYYNDQNACS